MLFANTNAARACPEGYVELEATHVTLDNGCEIWLTWCMQKWSSERPMIYVEAINYGLGCTNHAKNALELNNYILEYFKKIALLNKRPFYLAGIPTCETDNATQFVTVSHGACINLATLPAYGDPNDTGNPNELIGFTQKFCDIGLEFMCSTTYKMCKEYNPITQAWDKIVITGYSKNIPPNIECTSPCEGGCLEDL